MKKFLILTLEILMTLSASADGMKFIDAKEFPLSGKITSDTPGRYERLSNALQKVSRPELLYLGRHSTGLYIRFRSNTTKVQARWTSSYKKVMNHMSPTGSRGLDLYILENDVWRFAGSARPDLKKSESTSTIIADMIPEEREFMLYLSLYDNVGTLSIGVDQNSHIGQPELNSPKSEKPIVYYGTSILQGGCVTRPGMVNTSIIERELDREVINLGFSGNALLDFDIADFMTQVEDPGLFVLDYVPNTKADRIREKGLEFFKILRAAHPDVPVVLIECPYFPRTRFDHEFLLDVQERNQAQKELFAQLKKLKFKNIYYVPADGMMGDDGEDSVDGEHFTDLGMKRYCQHVIPYLKKAMKKIK